MQVRNTTQKIKLLTGISVLAPQQRTVYGKLLRSQPIFLAPISATLDRQNLDRPHIGMQADSQVRTLARTASARVLHSAGRPYRVGKALPLPRSFLPSAPRTSAQSYRAPLRHPAANPGPPNTYFPTCRMRAHTRPCRMPGRRGARARRPDQRPCQNAARSQGSNNS